MIYKLGSFISWVLAVAVIQSCGSAKNASVNMQANTLTNQERQDGWMLLFDGSTTNGWHTYGKNNVGAAWKVVDGSLYFDTTKTNGKREGGGDIVTNDEYENYHLSLEWKVAPGSNSGVIFNVHEDAAQYKNTYETGPEMQVLDNDRHPDAKIHKHRAGDLYDLIASSKEAVRPVGEWNRAEIVLNNGKLNFYLNGTNTVSTTMWDNNWNTMVANSKFKTMPGFAKFKKGRIALQDHGDPVWYRNIKLRRL